MILSNLISLFGGVLLSYVGINNLTNGSAVLTNTIIVTGLLLVVVQIFSIYAKWKGKNIKEPFAEYSSPLDYSLKKRYESQPDLQPGILSQL